MTTKQSTKEEIKRAMKDFIKEMDTELIGRPLWVCVIGENGWDVMNAPNNQFTKEDNIDILISILTDMIKPTIENLKE